MKRRFSPRFHKAPDFYSPYGTGSRGDNRISLVKRKNLILGLMVEQNYITQEKADGAKAVDTLKKLMPKKSVKFARRTSLHTFDPNFLKNTDSVRLKKVD